MITTIIINAILKHWRVWWSEEGKRGRILAMQLEESGVESDSNGPTIALQPWTSHLMILHSVSDLT